MKEKKHILFLAEWFPHPGDQQLGVFIQKHARAAALYQDVTVIHILPQTDLHRKYEVFTEQKEYKLIRVSYACSKLQIQNIFRYRNAFRIALKNCIKPDFVHLHVCGKNAAGRIFFLRNIPFAVSEHWSGYLKEDGKFLSSPLLCKRTFRKAKWISAPSSLLKKSLEKLTGRTDIEIVPNVIEESSLKLKKPEITQMLVVADMVDEIKNISGILDALLSIRDSEDSFRMNVKFIGSGKDRSWLELKAENITTENIKIEFHDSLPNDEVLNELKRSSFLVVNSRAETFSVITAEALLSGIPVIATRCGGPEIFVNDSNGILIDVDDVPSLAKAILRMSKNHSQYDPEQISLPVRSKYSLNKIGGMLSDLYSIRT